MIQSSSAFIGIMITLSLQGLLTLEASVPLILGANIGTSATALLASIKTSSEAQKVAIAHALFKIFGAFLFLWWIPGFIEMIREFTFLNSQEASMPLRNTPRQIANTHTIFNVALALILLPFMDYFALLINRLIKEKPAYSTVYLDKNVLKSSTPLALNLATEEVMRMGNIVEDMLRDVIAPFFDKKENQLQYIAQKEREVNFLRDKIKDYLLGIARQDSYKERVNETFQLVYTVKEFEQIADLVSFNIAQKAHSWCNAELEFSEVGKNEIADYHKRALKQIHRAIEVLREVNLEKAKHMKKSIKNIEIWPLNWKNNIMKD